MRNLILQLEADDSLALLLNTFLLNGVVARTTGRTHQRILSTHLRAIHFVGWGQGGRRRSWKWTWRFADRAGTRRSFSSCWAWRFLHVMADGCRRASADGMRMCQLLLTVGAFDGHRLTKSQWPALWSEVTARWSHFLPRLLLMASITKATDGCNWNQENDTSEADAHHCRGAQLIQWFNIGPLSFLHFRPKGRPCSSMIVWWWLLLLLFYVVECSTKTTTA